MALRQAEEEADRCEAERTRRFESWAAASCTLCLAVSEREAEAVRTLLGVSHVRVVPNGVDTAHFMPGQGDEVHGQILFTGTMDYAPNIEAVHYFIKAILPLIHALTPDATFQVVGTRPTQPILQTAGGAVVVHGQVADMAPHFRETSVVVVPLLHGGGTRLKILEAAASGKAIVTTTLGMEGLDFRPGEDLLVADTPIEFAQAVVGLLRDPEHRRRLGRQAHREAQRYDWDASGEGLLRIVEEVAGKHPVGLAGVGV